MEEFNDGFQKIAVTGGKGGTGKSTLAILLARKYLERKKKVLLCDLDVECPNLYLVLGVKRGRQVASSFTQFPRLIKSKCRKCGLCAQKCRQNAIFWTPGRYPVFIRDLCAGCGLCGHICPFGAIEMKKEESGRIFLEKIYPDLFLLTGIAKAGIEETGPIVQSTKEEALDIARRYRFDYVVFDTAAGIHCPVIHALWGVDKAFVVTEPTPLGRHDLGKIVELLKKIGVEYKIVLNQANLGNKGLIKTFDYQIPYSLELAQAYSKGKLLRFDFDFGLDLNNVINF